VRLFCLSVELRNGSADAFLLSAGVICLDAEAPDSTRQAQCPSTEPWNDNVEAFLLDARAKSLGVGVICSDARTGKGNTETLSSDAGAKHSTMAFRVSRNRPRKPPMRPRATTAQQSTKLAIDDILRQLIADLNANTAHS
jgi:hypothetical protein